MHIIIITTYARKNILYLQTVTQLDKAALNAEWQAKRWNRSVYFQLYGKQIFINFY